MVLADPGRMHAELLGIERLRGDVGDELVRGAGIVLIMIVAQREITELHLVLPEWRAVRPVGNMTRCGLHCSAAPIARLQATRSDGGVNSDAVLPLCLDRRDRPRLCFEQQ